MLHVNPGELRVKLLVMVVAVNPDLELMAGAWLMALSGAGWPINSLLHFNLSSSTEMLFVDVFDFNDV